MDCSIAQLTVAEKAASAFEPGDHGATYGGNPFVTAAVSKVFDLFESENILEHVKEISIYLQSKLDELVEKYDFILERRGKGLMQGLEFNGPVKEYILEAMDKGLIIIAAGPNILRFVPPLIITKENVDEMIHILESCLEK